MGRVQLTLDLEFAAEPIVGELGAPGEEPQRFAGYLQLIQALERFRASHAHCGISQDGAAASNESSIAGRD